VTVAVGVVVAVSVDVPVVFESDVVVGGVDGVESDVVVGGVDGVESDVVVGGIMFALFASIDVLLELSAKES